MRRHTLLALALLSIALAAACSRGPRLVVYAPAGVVDRALAEAWEAKTQWALEVHEFAQLEPLLVLEPGTDCGVILLPGDRVPELTAAGGLRPLDASRLPHSRELAPRFRTEPSDGANEHSIPVAFRLAGIAHPAAARGPSTWADALPAAATPESPVVGLQPDPALVVGAALIASGLAPTSTDREDHQIAAARLRALAPRVAGYDGSAHLADAEASFAICWSQALPEGAAFTVPADGTLLATLRAAVPITSPHPDRACAFIDFLLAPERNAAWTTRRGFGGVTAEGTRGLHAVLHDQPVWWLVRIERALPLRDRLWTALRGDQ